MKINTKRDLIVAIVGYGSGKPLQQSVQVGMTRLDVSEKSLMIVKATTLSNWNVDGVEGGLKNKS